MANHSKHARSSTFAMPSKSSLVKIAATVAAVGLLTTGGIVSRNLYTSAEQNTANQVTAFSVTDSAHASRVVSYVDLTPPMSNPGSTAEACAMHTITLAIVTYVNETWKCDDGNLL